MLRDFVAIDVETANGSMSSICSLGCVIVRDGRQVDSLYSLVHPEPNYYNYFCQRVHGLSRADTDSAEVFSKVWAEVYRHIVEAFDISSDPYFELANIPFVAHNAPFDEGCLKAAFKVYQMTWPDYLFLDTLRAARRLFGRSLPNHQLQTVAAACGYDLSQHHHALFDAEACAAIALQLL